MRWVTLTEWAAPRYSRVSIHTLRRWARAGEFSPPARRVGREYMVLETAEHVQVLELVGRPTIVEQLMARG